MLPQPLAGMSNDNRLGSYRFTSEVPMIEMYPEDPDHDMTCDYTLPAFQVVTVASKDSRASACCKALQHELLWLMMAGASQLLHST